MGNNKITSSSLVRYYENLISCEIKFLIENLHLYQNHKLRFPIFENYLDEFGFNHENIAQKEFPQYKDIYEQIPLLPWDISQSNDTGYSSFAMEGGRLATVNGYIAIEPPSPIKLFCSQCKDVEPYNFIGVNLVIDNLSNFKEKKVETLTQLFVLTYQCQSCRGLPETFLIRRKGVKISLHGKSPIEQFPVNKIIPKNQNKFFSDSRIAFNSGQVLAAIFLIRTFVEQFIREKAQDYKSREMDILFEQYSNKLPEDFNSRFPSLKSVYDRLSEDIHSANASEETYNNAKDDIENHFDALRLYEKYNLIDWQ